MMKIKLKQQGQVLILGLFFTCISLLLVFVYYNTIQDNHERQQASNIADTAVYSGLQFQTRSLNYIAYTNRAIIANHVAVGQIVSTMSWLDYVSETTQAISFFTAFIPSIGPIISRGFQTISNAAEYTVEFLPALIGQSAIALSALEFSQNRVYDSTRLETLFFIQELIKRNDARYKITTEGYVFLAKSLAQYSSILTRATSEEDLDTLAQMIMDSRDSWSTSRNSRTTFLVLPHPLGYQTFGYGQTGKTHFAKVRNSNGTSSWVWDSTDIGVIQHSRPRIRGLRVRMRTRNIPLPNRVYHTTRNLQQSQNITRSYKVSHAASRWNYKGVGSYLKLRHDDTNETHLELALEVGIDQRLLNSKQLFNTTKPSQNDSSLTNTQSRSITAMSKGEIIFERPFIRSDEKEEYSNLFNPFWIVRLKQSHSEKSLSWLAKGLRN